MPNETRNYVPKLQAIKNIVAEPELFHLELPYVANEQHFVTLDAPTGIDLATAAAFADMSLEEFLALNPGYNRPAITSPGQTLVVPADRASRFEARLSEFAMSGKGWRTHELEPGEKLDAVANRHGLTVTQLMQLNGLASGSRLSAGQTLLVPDGIDPSGALAIRRLLPGNSRLSSPPAVKLNARTVSGKSGKKSTKKTSRPSKRSNRTAKTPSKPAQKATSSAAKTKSATTAKQSKESAKASAKKP
jgi:membrane-bound lytic murein transglycosylase D